MSTADRWSSAPVPQELPIAVGLNAGPVDDFEARLGPGEDLWADDSEFEAFLVERRRWRQQDRDESRRS
jgi:hypothetical protein